MDQGVVDSPVILVIRAPNQKYDDQTINCYQSWTVEKLKAHLSDVYPSKPVSVFAPAEIAAYFYGSLVHPTYSCHPSRLITFAGSELCAACLLFVYSPALG